MHPQREELAAYLVGSLPESGAHVVEGHVQSCPECEATLNLLGNRSDTMLEKLRGGPPAVSADAESACRAMVEVIKDLGRDPTIPGAAAATPEAAELGSLREYKLLKKLGEGGMGAVYRALHTKLDKIVALKVLPGGRMQNSDAVARFEREMKAVGKLRHPNIVGAFDAGEANGMHFLVMELVDGENLSALIKQHAPLAVADACELVRQAAVGLQEAHEHGMVHRDIKPSNLMLTVERRKGLTTGTVKVLDMGLALLDASQPGGGDLTGTGQLMGTLHYMAPEQANDTHAVDIRADIYGLGVVLYELLTGKIPLEAKRNQSIVSKLMALTNDPTPSIGELRRDLPPSLIGLVDLMLAKKPGERPAAPDDVATALEPFAVEHHIAALLDPTAVRAPRAVASANSSSVSFTIKPTAATTVAARRSPPRIPPRVALGFAGAAAFFIALGVWFVVRDKDGKEIARVEAPEGSSISIVTPESSTTLPTKKAPVPTITSPAKTADVVRPLVEQSQYVETAEFAAWKQKVAGLSPPEQLAAILAKLKELNPGFDMQVVKHKIEGGVVTVLKLPTDQISDISPLRALSGLASLELTDGTVGDARKDAIDLMPLSSLPLRHLVLIGKRISDLAALRGLKLTSLKLARTRVTDLTPLQGMPLQALDGDEPAYPEATLAALDVLQSIKTLETAFGRRFVELQNERPTLEQLVALVRELRQANPNYDGTVRRYKYVNGRITELVLDAPGLNDFSALAPLKSLESLILSRGNYWRPTNLSALSGLRPTKLGLGGCEIEDLSPFRDMPLSWLEISHTRVRDLSQLKKMPLVDLLCTNTPWRDGAATCNFLKSIPSLKTFNGKPAAEFFSDPDGVAELETLLQKLAEANPEYDRAVRSRKLENGHLTELSLDDDTLKDFSALRMLPALKVLDLGRGHTWHAKDWTFLQEMKLTGLNLTGAQIADLAPLKGMPLAELDLSHSKVLTDLLPLKGLPLKKLRLDGDVPVTDLTPLTTLPLVELQFDKLDPQRDAPILNSINTLKMINRVPADSYWRKAGIHSP
ncbi:MAG: protein kinase [Planctomycetia bacterium]|nr:protein kinase [Planctomycetia bacterium]